MKVIAEFWDSTKNLNMVIYLYCIFAVYVY